MADYIDRKLAGRIADAKNFYNVTNPLPTDFGLTIPQIMALQTAINTVETDLIAETTLATTLRSKRKERRDADKAMTALHRQLAMIVQNRPETTDAQRAALKLTIEGENVPDESNALVFPPLLQVTTTGRFTHTINFFSGSASEPSKKKPAGVFGAKIYCLVGATPPAGIKDCELLTLDRNTPYVMVHDETDAGKTAHYIAVWVDEDDEESPQSETFSITIQG